MKKLLLLSLLFCSCKTTVIENNPPLFTPKAFRVPAGTVVVHYMGMRSTLPEDMDVVILSDYEKACRDNPIDEKP